MDKIIYKDKILSLYEYANEEEFEKMVCEHAVEIFGPKSIYINIKKKIGDSIATIPDGYLIDYTFSKSPQLYIVENELAIHDAVKHIGQQLLKFAISSKVSGLKIKSFIFDYIQADEKLSKKAEEALAETEYSDLHKFLESLIFNIPVNAVVVIDSKTEDLVKIINHIKLKIDIIEFQTYTLGDLHLHKFTPLHEEFSENISDSGEEVIDVDEIDTIVVPANEEGFNKVFLGEDCWYSIRVSSAMLERIKYIAGYQTAPISAITHYAEVESIERYEDTDKYILYFKGKAKQIKEIKLVPKPQGKIKAPQSSRYTSFNKLVNAKNLDEVF